MAALSQLVGFRATRNPFKGAALNPQDNLALQLARLKSPDELDQKGEGLTFVFSKGGVGKYSSAKATHRLAPGDVLVFNRAAGGRIGVYENKPEFLFWTFSVEFEHLLPLFSASEISLLHAITENLKVTKNYPASHPLAVECQRLLGVVPPELNLDHRGQLIRIAASILSLEFKDARGQHGGYVRAEDHMVQVFEKLSSAELINLSVGELADRFSCSRRHLNRLFHQHFGVSVASLRMEMRLLKAVSLLRDASAKIINVAEQSGFNHLGLFNTCFKRRFGVSPGQWRKSPSPVGNPAPRKTASPTVCPLQGTGKCPLVGRHAISSPEVLEALAGKSNDGAKVMADLKQPAGKSGQQFPPKAKGKLAQPRAGA